MVRSLRTLGLWVVLGCYAIGVLHGQQQTAGTFDFESAREPVVKLDGLWRFHPGDDPRWAEPGFDDSGWAAVRGDKSWGEQGYKGLSGYAWYRARVVVPAGTKDLSLFIPGILTDFQCSRTVRVCRDAAREGWISGPKFDRLFVNCRGRARDQ